jgi:hypothetical protein
MAPSARPPAATSVHSTDTLPNAACSRVIEIFMAADGPLSRGQVSARSGLRDVELGFALAELCESGRLRRLNTVVESYVFPREGRPQPRAEDR